MGFSFIEWEIIDGRQMPFTNPQHPIGINNYVETGKDNHVLTADKTATQTANDLKVYKEVDRWNIQL